MGRRMFLNEDMALDAFNSDDPNEVEKKQKELEEAFLRRVIVEEAKVPEQNEQHECDCESCPSDKKSECDEKNSKCKRDIREIVSFVMDKLHGRTREDGAVMLTVLVPILIEVCTDVCMAHPGTMSVMDKSVRIAMQKAAVKAFEHIASMLNKRKAG
jgi:hypothetical protein